MPKGKKIRRRAGESGPQFLDRVAEIARDRGFYESIQTENGVYCYVCAPSAETFIDWLYIGSDAGSCDNCYGKNLEA